MLAKINCVIALLMMGLIAPLLQAQQPTYKAGQYPAPRYPEVPKNPTVEDLMPTARTIVRRPPISYQPGYAIKAGEKVLFMVNKDYSPLVIEALRRAITEMGARADILTGGVGWLPGEGVREWDVLSFMDDNWKQYTGGIGRAEQIAIALAGKYNVVVAGAGGGNPPGFPESMRWVEIPWIWPDQFLVNGAQIPTDLVKFIDDTAYAMLSKAVQLHATDPEGTDITWITTPETWEVPDVHIPGHLMSHPPDKSYHGNGVIAGTWNHTGPFPYLRASFKDDRMEGIEGGGAFGQMWREMRSRWSDVKWTGGKTGPGLFTWLQECAVGTDPKVMRPKESFLFAKGSNWERRRSGVIHWGIGAGGANFLDPANSSPAAQEYFKAHPETPTGHVHIHNYFLTIVLTNADGSKTTFINKGHLTALDDPKVRQMASRYGDPDELLREAWIPAIPGINVPGNYMNDYAKDPSAWVRKDLANYKY